jgi:4-oxalocrotonate tautomerase
MPTIRIDGPPIPDIDRKRDLVRRLTRAAVEIYGIEHITVIIRENPPENVGADGTLIADLHKR